MEIYKNILHFHSFQNNELDKLEILLKDDNDDQEEIMSPPPIPPRTLSLPSKTPEGVKEDFEERKNAVNNEKTIRIQSRPLPPAPISSLDSLEETNSDQDTTDDEDELPSDSSKNSESEISEKEITDEEIEEKPEKMPEGFNANASLPPIPNGTFDINSDKQMSSSEGEMYDFFPHFVPT
jgi:hypothetical protein